MTNDHNEMNDALRQNLRQAHHITTWSNSGTGLTGYRQVNLTVVPNLCNPNSYDDWVAMGQEWWKATNGSTHGRTAWMQWSAQSAKKYDPEFCIEKWTTFGKGRIAEIMSPALKDSAEVSKQDKAQTASMLLGQAKELLDQWAKDYDKPGGERSMGTVAAMFNLATGRTGDCAISESEAWLVMDLLKIVRDRHTPHGHQDSCEDHVSYAALYGEARLREKWEASTKTSKVDQ